LQPGAFGLIIADHDDGQSASCDATFDNIKVAGFLIAESVPSLINIVFELDILEFDQKPVIISLQKSKNMFFAVIKIVNFAAVAP